jgi:Flp pilus assembly pilin Flp
VECLTIEISVFTLAELHYKQNPNSKIKYMEVFSMMKTLRNKMMTAGLKAKNALANESGDQMTGWLIVVLIVVVVGAVFMTLYQSSITQIWNSIVSKITGLLG